MWRAITVVLGCLLLASGCQALPNGGTATLQGAIEQYLQTTGQTRLSPVDVKITRSFDGGALVMYSYERAGGGTRLVTICTQQMRQQWLLWHAGGRGCSSRPAGPIGQVLAPIDFETVSSNSGASYTYTNGLVSDPVVHAVAVTFAPGVRQVVPVEHGAYLAVIAPGMRTILVDIEALDERGAVLYHTTYP